MFLNRLYFVFCFFFISLLCFGQNINSQTGTIKSIQIQSNYLSQEKNVEIFLPRSYNSNSKKKYPVVYVLDGQEYFLNPISYQRMLFFKEKSPEFIVVGIDSDRRKRRRLYYQFKDHFINFIEKELIPQIEHNYRIIPTERSFFGWEMAGGLALDFFTHNNTIFNAYFIASPTHITKKRLINLDNTLKAKPSQETFFYITKAKEETFLEASLYSLDSIFKNASATNIKWKYDTFNDEDHYTTPTKTIHNGLRKHFSDYNPLRFLSLEEYDNFGNFQDIKNYYLKRGKRYHIPSEIHKTTRHFLLYHSMRKNNFKRFKIYAQEFQNHLHDLSLDIWVTRFGDYLLENNEKEMAKSIYDAGLKKFPESAKTHNSIGTYYKSLKNKNRAKYYYQKAIDLAIKNEDLKIKDYKKNLNSL